jgi:tellurite resistance protein TehA-like permease
MKIIFWIIVVLGVVYSFWYTYFLLKDKNKLGAIGMIFIGILIVGASFFVRLK